MQQSTIDVLAELHDIEGAEKFGFLFSPAEYYIAFEDLIKNKLAVGRLQDLADVEALRASEAANAKLQRPNKA